jgi:hypothetical protein
MRTNQRIKFLLSLVNNFIKVDRTRVIIILAAVLLLITIFFLPKETKFYEVERYIVEGDTHYYKVNNQILEYDREQKLFIDNGDTLIKTKEWYEGQIVLATISLLVIVGGLITYGVEPLDEWEIKKIYTETIKKDLKEHVMEGEYVYTSYSKLLKISKQKQAFYDIEYSTNLTGIKNFFNRENYYTKSEIRDNKLNKLGI